MDREVPRELLRHAISDIQGSIHANDNKSSAGLLVQGLLATAIVTLVGNLSGFYGEATNFAQILIKLTLAATLVLGGLSIFCLILAVVPYKPDKQFIDRNFEHRAGVYFPDIEALKKKTRENNTPELSQLKSRFKQLTTDEHVDDEYLGELLVVADIRFKEARWAQWGFRFLGAELIFAFLYLGTVGAIAGDIPGATSASPASSLRWETVHGADRRSLPPVGRVSLPYSSAQIRLQAEDPEGGRFVKVARVATYDCVRRGRIIRGRVTQRATQNARLFGARRAVLVDLVALSRLRCPSGMTPQRAVWRFRAQALSEDDGLTSGLLVLRLRS